VEVANETAGEPGFDVLVRLPSGARLDQVKSRGEAAGVTAERLDALVNALRNLPQVQIGKNVSRARADAAKTLYEQCGLVIEINPVLALETKRATLEISCPSCRQRVIVTDKGQCPGCGVFVEKFTDDYMQKKRQLELDRAKLRHDMEAEFQAKLDAALVEKLRKQGVFKGRSGAMRAAALVGLLGAAFIVGRGTLAGWNKETLLATSNGGKAARMMDTAWPSTPGAGPDGEPGVVATAAAGAVDPEMDDPLIQQASGAKRMGGKGLTIEQAVAASRALARSVGNTTADRAMADGPAAGPAGGEGVAESGAAASAGAAVPAAGPAVTVPATAKLALGLDLARQLAAMGQTARAEHVLKALGPRLQAVPELASKSQAAALEIRAWTLGSLAPGQAGATAKSLLADAEKISDVPTRVLALTQAGVAVSQQPRLPREAARALLTRAGDLLASVAADQREQAMGTWAAGLGSVLLNEANAAARAGRWSVVKANGAQLQALAQQAPNAASQARVLAMSHQLQTMLGDAAGADKAIDAALALAAAPASLQERAVLLRGVAAGTGIAGEKFLKAVDALQAQAQGRGGIEKAQVMVELSVLNAEAGFRAKAAEAAQAARQVPGLAPADATRIEAELLMRGDLAAARLMQTLGMYAEAEALLERVGGYLI
jgi:hypothetical protein